MVRAASGRRGQPVLFLALIIASWATARISMWSSPLAPMVHAAAREDIAAILAQRASTERGRASDHEAVSASSGSAFAGQDGAEVRPRTADGDRLTDRQRAEPPGWYLHERGLLWRVNPGIAPPPDLRPQAEAAEGEYQDPAVFKDDPRWTFDRWLLMRAGSGDAAQAPGAASYGASQAGAIARFRLGGGAPRESYVYLRTSLALNAPAKDKEIAIGFGMRPIARVPVRVLAEARLQDSSHSAVRIRPVATVISELPWQRLPFGFRGEAYGQAGYAGGRDATAFFDVQAVADRQLDALLPKRMDLRIGAGVWAGGQKGAVRVDAGPRVSFRMNLGEEVPSRIALDWRFRLTGNARPGSGPALTIASSF